MVLLAHIIAVLVIAYAGLGLILFFMQSTFLYRPTREIVYTPEDLGIDFEKVALKTSCFSSPDSTEITS